MKNKIMIMALAVALLVGLVPPSSAMANTTETTADDIKYKDIEDFMHSKGYTSFVKEDGCYYIFVGGESSLYYSLYKVKGNKDNVFFCTNDIYSVIFLFGDDVEVTRMEYYSYSNAAKNNNYELQRTSVSSTLNGYYNIKPDNPRTLRFTHNGISATYYSDVNIYQCNFNSSTNLLVPGTDVILYESNIDSASYNFERWCSDAGLNCSFADLEGNAVECRYADMLVVRQGAHVVGGNGYYLTQVNIAEDSAIFPTLIDWHVGLATMSNDWLSYYVKQYVYDYYDGRWEMCDDVVTQEVKAGSPIPSVGCALSDSLGLVFSNRDLYASDYSVAFEKSEMFVSEPYYAPSVPQEPEVTPSPSPDIGYDVYVYRPSLVGKVGLNNSKIYELPSAGSEALAAFLEGWTLSIQGYCYDNGGVIWYLCSAVRDDITYTGYMPATHVKVEPFNGIDVSFGDISVDDIPSVIESAKDGLLSALELVSVVPLMMGAVFGFLPSWCLLMVGVAFVLICVVGLIKVFRG